MSEIVIARQFCGPPNSGNGGYVCGLLSRELEGPATAVLRAPIPLDAPLRLTSEEGAVVLLGEDGLLIGRGQAAPDFELPEPPAAPSLKAARAARERYIGFTANPHPICFTCGTARDEGDGLRVFVGQLEGAQPGVMAGVWTPHAAFAEADGLASVEAIWAALDCPGVFAWIEKEGRHGALLGTMTAEVLRRPQAGEETIVMAWPLERQGRKELAGTALYSAEGELLARAHQVWITIGGSPSAAAA